MTFDDGTDSKKSGQTQITESLIRLVTQIAISIGVIGTFLVAVLQGNREAAELLQPITLGLIAFWLGQSVVSGWTGIQRTKIESEGKRNE